jgi:hypothetical protein
VREIGKCHHPLRSLYGAPVIIENPYLVRTIPSTPPSLSHHADPTFSSPLSSIDIFPSLHKPPLQLHLQPSTSRLISRKTNLPLLNYYNCYYDYCDYHRHRFLPEKFRQEKRTEETEEREKKREISEKERAREKIEESVKVRRVKDEKNKKKQRKNK